jgi:ubiquinone biosynthesis protein
VITTLFNLARLARAAWTLARHDAIFPAEYQQAFPAPARLLGQFARLIAIRDRADNPGERLARALEKLGPSYVKFGQVLATRADVIGPRFARGLARLQDKMDPFDRAIAVKTMEDEFSKPIDQLFSDFGEPIAAASIAQVHKATTVDGKTVAVKVLRPDVERKIRRDISVLRLGASLAEGLFPQSKRMEPKAFVETVARSLQLELDLRLEAASASELSEAAVAAQNFHLPEIDWTRSAKRVLTTEWIDAIPMTDMERVKASGVDTVKLAADLTDAFLTTALERGVFHADLHAGNLFVGEDGRLWAVDFGIMGRLGRDERRYLAAILHGFLFRNYEAAAEAHFDAGYVPGRFSKADFASALRAVAEPIFGKTASETPMSRVLLQLFEITDLFDMHLQPQLVLLQKTMVQAEGVCRLLTDDHNMWEASAPSVERFMRRELGPEARVRDALEELDRLKDAILALPQTVEQMGAVADTLAKSREAEPNSGSEGRWLLRAVAGAGLVAIGALGAVWVTGAI